MWILLFQKGRQLGGVIFFYAGIKMAALLKMSYIIGSEMAFFSATNVLHPIGGKMLGVSGSFLWFVLTCAVRLGSGASMYLSIIYGLPGFCAALYMARSHMLIRLILPLICMILFIVHPVGLYAAPYAFYWLIPVVLYFVNKQSFFKDVLGATFVAHAVGSVAWLYLIPMPVSYWWGLIPIVAVERLSFATAAVLVYSGYMYCMRIIKNLKQRKALLFYEQSA